MKQRKFWGIITAMAVAGALLAGCGNAGVSEGGNLKEAEISQSSGAASPEGADSAAQDAGASFYGEGQTESSENAAEGGTEILTENAAGSAYEQKLIRTVNLSLETMEFDSLIDSLKEKTEAVGGYTESSEISISAGTEDTHQAFLVLRIPAERLDAFLTQLEGEANITYSNESTEDVTLSYIDMQSHVDALRTEQESLLSMLENAKSMEDILAIQTQLTQVRYEIESCESQLRVYDNQVNYSTVNLDIREVARETSGAGGTFGDRVKSRFGDTLYRVGRGFTNFAVGFLGAVPILVILAAVAAVIVFVVKKVKKLQRRKLTDKKEKEDEGA